MRTAVSAVAQPHARQQPLPAPVRGWIESENLALNNGIGCSVFENWFARRDTVRLRGGHLKSATVGATPQTLMTWKSGGAEKLFAATASAIYDISALNPDTVPSAAVSSLTSGRWSYVQFGNGTANYIVCANGSDSMRYFDGSSWVAITGASSPIAITGVTTSDISFLWTHARRIWGVKKNSMDAYYLDTEVIGGTANKFPLGSLFKKGGSLVFGGSWTGDSGDGMDDRCVFVTDQGEVAVFQGIDPSSDETWSIVGRYDISRPMGTTTVAAGGDLLIAMNDGIVPISAVTTKDPAALALAAVTAPIETSWRRAMRKTNEPIQMMKWARETMMLVGLPSDKSTMFVANLQTGAWAKWTGMNAQCFGLYNDLAYFGSSDGNIYAVEASGADNGQPYVCRLSMLPNPLGSPGALKSIKQARGTFRALASFTPRLSVGTDYTNDFPSAPNATIDTSGAAIWDSGVRWDSGVKWDAGADNAIRLTKSTRWKSIGRAGYAVSGQVQVTCAGPRKPDAELVSLELSFIDGGVVV